MDSAKQTLLKNSIFASDSSLGHRRLIERKTLLEKRPYNFEQGQLYYDKPDPVSKIEGLIFWAIVAIFTFLFWKNVFQFVGVI